GDVSERSDRRTPAGLGHEAGRSLDLGAHRPGRELVAGQFLRRHVTQPSLLRGAPAQVDTVHVGGQLVGRVLAVDRADELHRAGECRVTWIYYDHGEQGRHLAL